MDSQKGSGIGVKGSSTYTDEEVGSDLLLLYKRLVRGSLSYHNLFEKLLGAGNICDLVVLIFQTRDVRGGKGERKLFTDMMMKLLENYTGLSEKLLPLVIEYGYWKDLWHLYGFNTTVDSVIENIVVKQYRLDQESEKPSLLVKWIPREDSKFSALAIRFAELLFPKEGVKRYRKTTSFLNKVRDTCEIKMCSGNWSKISPSQVPGRLMFRNKDAFRNTKQSSKQDRIDCAKSFTEHLLSGKKIAGAETTFPYEHIQSIIKGGDTLIADAQFKAIVEKTKEHKGLDKVVVLCDFSGSMESDKKMPLYNSYSLGILIGQVVTNPVFKNKMLTFDSNPSWVRFEDSWTMSERLHYLRNSRVSQGLSTNFEAAADLVLKDLVDNKVAVEDAPTVLLTITDMGFDKAKGTQTWESSWESHFQRITRNFKEYGYTPPTIVCWNVSSYCDDNHSTAHTPGVIELSGYSPSVLKAVYQGDFSPQEITAPQESSSPQQSPYSALRTLLDDKRYDLVRKVMEIDFDAVD